MTSKSPVQLFVPLSRLSPTRRNPRRVRPCREAHRRLVASVRAHGLIEPLVVMAAADPKHYLVIAGNRRLAALRVVHRGNDPAVPCVLRPADERAAEAVSLAENFAREGMHPLDEAEAFARLAGEEGKAAPAIAAEFGVAERYVRQRMKLATLAAPVKAAFRRGEIDTATAGMFAGVPADRQAEVWAEVGGRPRHPDHVRNVIAHGWIDAGHALFDPTVLPAEAVSRDLFGDRVLVGRAAFFEAQRAALEAERHRLLEDGWAEVVVGTREEVVDRLLAMARPKPEYDRPTAAKLARIDRRRRQLAAKSDAAEPVDEAAAEAVRERFDALDQAEREVVGAAPEFHSEATKAVATRFLVLHDDGRVERECRVPRPSHRATPGDGGEPDSVNGHPSGAAGGGLPKPPTSEDLKDGQLAAAFTHQALAVREALLGDPAARKRVLALVLHDKVNAEALAVRHEANGTTLLATRGETFRSDVFDRLRRRRAALDPFASDYAVNEAAAYACLSQLKAPKLNELIDLLVADCLTAHLRRETKLVTLLAAELKVNVRDHWRPDAAWLTGYQKIQLAHLIAELRGPVYYPAARRGRRRSWSTRSRRSSPRRPTGRWPTRSSRGGPTRGCRRTCGPPPPKPRRRTSHSILLSGRGRHSSARLLSCRSTLTVPAIADQPPTVRYPD